jgi:hypothetical protein
MSATSYLQEIDWILVPSGRVSIEFENEVGYNSGKVVRSTRHFSVAPFQIARLPVSNGLYQAFLDDPDGYGKPDRWRFSLEALNRRREMPTPSGTTGQDSPRTQVSWWDAWVFSNWMSEQLGYTVTLPSEPEWVRAAGDFRSPNPYGLAYPLDGLWEWCRLDNPINDNAARPQRKGRQRQEQIPLANNDHLGFRLARVETPKRGVGSFLKNLFGSKPAPAQTDTTPLMAQFMRESDPVKLSHLASEAGRLGLVDAVTPLMQVLTRTDTRDQLQAPYKPWLLREKAAEALGNIRDPRAVPALMMALRHEDNAVGIAAMKALVKLAAYESLVEALNDADSQVRRRAAGGLAGLHDLRAVEPLKAQAARETDETVQRSIHAALENLQK